MCKMVIPLILVFSLCWFLKYSTKPLLIEDIQKADFLTIYATKMQSPHLKCIQKKHFFRYNPHFCTHTGTAALVLILLLLDILLYNIFSMH